MDATVTAEHEARYGVWTPWAEILCLACDYEVHGDAATLARYPQRRRLADPTMPITALQYHGDRNDDPDDPDQRYPAPAQCERCRAACWTRSDVSLLQRLIFALGAATWDDDTIPGAVMRQTGGMCAAMVLVVAGHEIVATDAENDDPEGLYLGIYATEDWDECLSSDAVSTVADAVAWITAQARILLAS